MPEVRRTAEPHGGAYLPNSPPPPVRPYDTFMIISAAAPRSRSLIVIHMIDARSMSCVTGVTEVAGVTDVM